jgi:predicted RNase H-like HicB family nuclease
MKTTALIEKGKDGTFGIFTPNINSTIIGSGDTVLEAKADFENSVKEIIQFYKEDGIELPEELCNIEFEYKWDIASVFDYFNWINASKLAKTLDITPSLMRYYKKKNSYISEMQARKIETGLHRLADELKAVSL